MTWNWLWCYFWIDPLLNCTGLKERLRLCRYTKKFKLGFQLRFESTPWSTLNKKPPNLQIYTIGRRKAIFGGQFLLFRLRPSFLCLAEGKSENTYFFFFSGLASMTCSSGSHLPVLQITIITGILSTSVLLYSGHGKLTQGCYPSLSHHSGPSLARNFHS